MRKIRASVLAALLLSLTGSISACSTNTGEQPSSKPVGQQGQDVKPTPAEEPKKPAEPMEMVFFSNAGNKEDFFNKMFKDPLTQKFPHIKVKYIMKGTGSDLPDLITAGTKVDFYLEASAAISIVRDLKLEYDITEQMKKYNFDLSRFEQEGLKQAQADGKYYSMPVYANTLMNFYNKELFDRFGVPYPKDNMTWDEAIDLGKRITRNDGGKQYIGLWVAPKPYLRQSQHKLEMVDPKTFRVSIQNDTWKQVFETVFKRPTEDANVRASLQTAFPGHPEFFNGEIGMYVMINDLYYRNIDAMSKMKWDAVSLPVFKELPGVGSQPNMTNLFPLSISQHKEEQMEALNFFTSDEYQTFLSKQGFVTPLKSEKVKEAIGTESSFKDKNLKGALFGNKFAPSRTSTLYDDKLVEEALDKKAIKDIQLGLTDVNTALRQAEELANNLITTELAKK